MNDEMLNDELSQMYEEESKAKKTLDAETFRQPIKHLRVKKAITMTPQETVAAAVELMQNKKIGCVLVTENRILSGIFTERDVLLKAAGSKNYHALKLSDVMTPHVDAFEPDDSIAFVLNAMHVGGYRHVPVIDKDRKPIAVISVKDIITFILEHFAEDVLNLPPAPLRKTDAREGA
jgi:CBS domain-containing protein